MFLFYFCLRHIIFVCVFFGCLFVFVLCLFCVFCFFSSFLFLCLCFSAFVFVDFISQYLF